MKGLWILLFCLFFNSGVVTGQDIAAQIRSMTTDREKAEKWLELGAKFFLKPRLDSALYCYSEGLPHAERAGNPLLTGRFLLGKSVVISMQGRFRESLQYARQLGAYAIPSRDYELLFGYYMTQANCLNFLQLKDSALFFYRQAELLNNAQKPKENWRVYLAMGQLYSEADNFSESEVFFKKAYQLTAVSGSADHGYVLLLFINMYNTWGKKEEGALLKKEYSAFKAMQKRTNSPDQLSGIIENLSEESGKENAVPGGKMDKSAIGDILVNSRKVEELISKRETEKALLVARENEQLARQLDNPAFRFQTARKSYDILKSLHRDKEAADLADTLLFLRDSVLDKQRRDLLYEMQAKFDMERKQQEIELLTSRQLLSDREIEVLNSQNALKEKTIALLSADKELSSLKLLQQLVQQEALERENRLMDSIVTKEKNYSLSLTREKEIDKKLNAALDRENKGNERALQREKKIRVLLSAGGVLLLLAGLVIGLMYRKQRVKNRIIQKQADNLEILMKEIHHRVKNNMQIVSSLLDMQSMSIKDSQAAEAVKEGKNRVQSMALIHQNLYHEQNLKGIKAKPYITNLLQSLCDSYNITSDRVQIRNEVEDLSLDVDTMIPIGLILNEILTNSFKYAFVNHKEGLLEVMLKYAGDELVLRVKDNGPGFPAGLDVNTSASFGIKMIRAFAHKLRAKLEMVNDNGALVELNITKFSLA